MKKSFEKAQKESCELNSEDALLQCEINILAKFNNPQQVLFRCIKRKQFLFYFSIVLHYLIKVYFVPDQFSVNGFFLFCFVLFVC